MEISLPVLDATEYHRLGYSYNSPFELLMSRETTRFFLVCRFAF